MTERSRSAVIVSPNPSSRAGGVERVCAQIGAVLELTGWDVSIVGPSRPVSRWEFRLGLGYPAQTWSATATARTKPAPELIVTNGFLGAGAPRRIPRIHLYHGTMVGNTKAQGDTLPLRERLRRTASAGLTEALAGRGAQRIVCVSELVAKEVHRYYRLHADAVIPNSVDTELFAPRDKLEARDRLGLPQTGRYALFVGRLEHGKGSDLVLQGAHRGGYELLIAGATGTPGSRHLGVLEPEVLAHAYAASDCVLLPSRYEGCSLVVLEALASERPLLTTRVGWMSTFLRGVPEYDTLCIEPDVEDIAGHLHALSRERTDPLCSRARAFVLEHNGEELWSRRWQDLISALVCPQGGKGAGR
jgi:glycosyltransferase involved in cell wall biosynthesis